MSGRGRTNYRGGSCSGRGQGRGSGRTGKPHSKPNNQTDKKGDEVIKFVPHYTGKQQVVTYDSVKEHIIQHIQHTFKFGSDMVNAIRNDEYGTPGGGRPRRQLANIYQLDEEGQPTDVKREDIEIKLEQDGYDLEYTEELRNYNQRVQVYEENKYKAYALIFGYCNKTMQSRIEEIGDFETRIRNDPLVLLSEIKQKMYDPARAKYEYVSLTESLSRILNTTQLDDESLVNYTKRFKQAREILRGAG